MARKEQSTRKVTSKRSAAPARRARSSDVSADRVRQILKERAKALAVRAEAVKTTFATVNIVEFQIGPAEVALETSFTIEVVPASVPVELPRSDPPLVGIALVRGALLPVFDLLPLLGFEHHVMEGAQRLLIIGVEEAEFAVAVDHVGPSRSIPVNTIRPHRTTTTNSALVQGLTSDGHLLLDGHELVNNPSLFLQSEGQRQ